VTTVRRAMEASHREYAEALRRGDAAALAHHFTQDAILLPENSAMQRWREAIQKWFASWLPTTTVQAFDVTTIDVTLVGSTAYDWAPIE
jgi:ketosteroid isomerase-like protein